MRCALVSFLAFAACEVPVVAQFPIGPIESRIDTADLDVPDALVDGASVATLPCPPEPESCPNMPERGLASACEDGVCDPVFDVVLDLGTVDLAEYRDLSDLGDSISSAEIRAILYAVRENSLNLDLPETEIHWAPETVASFDAPGVRKLGTVPSTAEGATPNGTVMPDAGGQQALADHLRSLPTSEMRFRLFVRTTVDLAPGQALPQGALALGVSIEVRLEGTL